MDMITKIELEDAIANRLKVEKRVVEVAMVIAGIEGTLEVHSDSLSWIKNSDWKLKNWRVDFSTPREGMEHLKNISCTVEFEVPWRKRPETEKFGEAGDREDIDFYEDEREVEGLVRRVQFPYEYLLTEGWRDEAAARHAATEKRMAAYHLENMDKAIKDSEKSLENMRKKRAELNKLANS